MVRGPVKDCATCLTVADEFLDAGWMTKHFFSGLSPSRHHSHRRRHWY